MKLRKRTLGCWAGWWMQTALQNGVPWRGGVNLLMPWFVLCEVSTVTVMRMVIELDFLNYPISPACWDVKGQMLWATQFLMSLNYFLLYSNEFSLFRLFLGKSVIIWDAICLSGPKPNDFINFFFFLLAPFWVCAMGGNEELAGRNVLEEEAEARIWALVVWGRWF